MQTMQESTEYINALQRVQCLSEDNGACTVTRERLIESLCEQHVPSQYGDDVLCSVSSSLSSSHNASSSHNVVSGTFDTCSNTPLLSKSALYGNSSATNILANPKDSYIFQPTYKAASESDTSKIGVVNTINMYEATTASHQRGMNMQQQTPSALEATVPYRNVSPVSEPTPPTPPTHTNQEHPRLDDTAHCQFLRVILEIVSKAVKCTVCQCTFNASVICSNYTIKLNRPIQCACGCVICLMCYTKDRGCRTHKLSSHRATVNVTANQLANATDVKWDLELDNTAVFRAECDDDTQRILHLDRGVPTADELKGGERSDVKMINV